MKTKGKVGKICLKGEKWRISSVKDENENFLGKKRRKSE